MKTVVIHDAQDERGMEIIRHWKEREERGWTFIDLAEKKILPCTGCFQCWTKTPGLCKVSDEMNPILREQLSSDRIIYLCPVSWGGCSPLMRTFQDRSLCLTLPFFRKVKGKTHHIPRYRQSQKNILVGYGKNISADEDRAFRGIGRQVSYNLYNRSLGIFTLNNSDEISALDRILEGEGE